MDLSTVKNLPTMFFEQAARKGDKPFVWSKIGGTYSPVTWREAAATAARVAAGLRANGVAPGDRVALVAESRSEWPIADLAIMAAGAISVPAYVTNTVADHLHILNNSGARAAIVSTRQLAKTLLPAAKDAATTELVVSIEELPADEHPAGVTVKTWQDVQDEGGEGGDGDRIVAAARDIERTAPSCIIHTSGTGGAPKGVTLSHGAILCNVQGAADLLESLGLEDEVFLSFLPLSHSYEHTAGLFFPVAIGAQIYYAERVDTLATNMVEVRPTIMTAVPRLYETMHQRIVAGVARSGGLKAKLFHLALDLGRRRYLEPASLSAVDRLKDSLVDKLVRDKVRERFGGRLKALVSGGAPLNHDIGLFFTALGLRLLQGYGQTESAPVISCNLPHDCRLHTVGPACTGVEVRIADDGEIVVRGENVMLGYWGDDEATSEVIRDGWLYTGDIGELDDDGFIQITDRKKDIIVNSGGDNISPQRIEGILALQPEVGQAMVYGDRRPHLVAVLVPDAEFMENWATAVGRDGDLAALADEPEFQEAMEAVVDRVNADLQVIERVRRFVIARQPFTVENEMMTPTLKIRRHKITAEYGDALEALYGHS